MTGDGRRLSTDILPVATGRETWTWLRRELRSRAGSGLLTLVVGLVAAATAVLPVYVLGVLVDRIIDGSPPSVIVMIAVVVTTAAVVGGLASGLSNYFIGRLGAIALADLREAGVERALSLPTATVERVGRGDVLSRVSTDVATIGKAVTDVIPTMFASILLAALSLVAMVGLDWRLGLAGAVAVPLYVFALRWYLPRSAPRYAEERRAIAERSQVLMESMIGSATVHAYDMHVEHQTAIETASARVRDISLAVFTLFTRFVGRINRAEFIGSDRHLGDGILAGEDRRRHGRSDDGRGAALPSTVQPDQRAALHLRRGPGRRREPGPPGRVGHHAGRSAGQPKGQPGSEPRDASLDLRGPALQLRR